VLKVRNLRVESFDSDALDILWEIDPTHEDPLDYDFVVLRSESPEGPWDKMSPPFVDKYWFRDTHTPPNRKFRHLFYAIQIIHRASATSEICPAAEVSANLPLDGLEIARQEHIVLREHNGRKVLLYTIRTFGQRCGCFNEILGTQIQSKCPECFGTGWVRGYFAPIEVYLQLEPTPDAEKKTSMGTIEPQNATARMGPYPPVKPGDVIIEAENIRWRINQRAKTERLRAVVHQELQLFRIEPGDIEYLLPVRWDVSENPPSETREFQNPHTPDRDSQLEEAMSRMYSS